jgi:hypothetical protein
MKKTFVSHAFFVLTLLMVPASALGYRFHYRAADYHSEPRFDRNCLSSVDVSVMGGSTKNGRNGDKNKTDVLNIYGLQEMRKLGEGVPNLDPLNIDDNLLITLRNKNSNGNFGKVRYTGKFKYLGADITFTQNFCNGFFAQVVMPIHRLEVSNVAYVDESPSTGVPASTDADWVQFKARLDNILTRHGLSAAATKDTNIGDLVFLFQQHVNVKQLMHFQSLLDTTDTLEFHCHLIWL